MADPVKIANCSGFFGDRRSAAREMVDGGPIDVLTGDWLAELTMLILARTQQRRPDGGYASSFLAMLEDVLGTCLERGIRVVSNAGGLDPAGCAAAVRALADRLGLRVRVAHVEGDDVREKFADTITANAYLGGRGIAMGLAAGADVVVTGRVTDAALVVGPAAWWHGWAWDDWDALAGAVVAGHIIECGPQTTGGNYSFFTEVADLVHPGFPIAEVAADGSSTITKHPGTGGLVSVDTVTAQLLYEIAAPEYANPDVMAHFDSIALEATGPDRVRVSGVRGSPPPPTLKVARNTVGGYRNSVTFVLTGLDIAEKTDLALRSLFAAAPRERFDTVDVALSGPAMLIDDPVSNDEAMAHLRVTVTSSDATIVGRQFSNAAVELALANYPGFFTTSPPADASPFGVYSPASIERADVVQVLVTDEGRHVVPDAPCTAELQWTPDAPGSNDAWPGATSRVPLGWIAGARSGDKGGDANVGVWVRTDAAYRWLAANLTTDLFRFLVSEAESLEVRRYLLPNLRAVNFVVVGLLGRGVAASTRTDAQAKGLGEFLRARHVDIPVELLDS